MLPIHKNYLHLPVISVFLLLVVKLFTTKVNQYMAHVPVPVHVLFCSIRSHWVM